MADEELRECETGFAKGTGPTWPNNPTPLTGDIELVREGKRIDLRIEALRAASRVVAGLYAGELHKAAAGGEVTVTLAVAEQFARWLETGER